jgi:hypothetical protein
MADPIDLAGIAALIAANRAPPVDQWHPAHCGDSGMRIAADGTWFHDGTPIGRPEMVRLFSTILRREPDGGYVLVTPGEKLDIAVDDAPFVAVAATSEGQGPGRRIAFRLNTSDHVIADADHPLRVTTAADGTPRPYLTVRRGLDALVNRATFYDLADWALAEGADPPGLWSGGVFFRFG